MLDKYINYFSIFIIIFTVISLIVILTLPRLPKKQPTIKEALESGLGHYGDEEDLGCQSRDGKCTSEGIQTTIQYCKPHPSTGNGCRDENGEITYSSVIRKKPCRLQCYSSNFLVQNGIQLKNPALNYDGLCINPGIEEVGCNRVVDKKFGLDYTDNFFGELSVDPDGNGGYFLNNCIPPEENSPYQSYYRFTETCLQADQKGSNNCKHTCGGFNLNILNISEMTNIKGAQELLTYYPQEISSTGDIKFSCYDINNKNQVEILNNANEVPENFVYPNKCYSHANVLDFNQNVWPTVGQNNVIPLKKDQVSKNVSYIDILPEYEVKFEYLTQGENAIISQDYDISKSTESYVKLRFGNEIALLDKIYDKTTSGILVNKENSRNSFYPDERENNLESRIFYVAMGEGDISSLSNEIKEGIVVDNNFSFKGNNINIFGSTVINRVPVTGDFYTKNITAYKDQYYFSENNYLYFPVNLYDVFRPTVYENSESIYNGVSTFVKIDEDPNFLSSGDLYVYMISKIPGTNREQGIYSKGNYNSGTSIITFGGSFFNASPVIDYIYVESSYFSQYHTPDTTFDVIYRPNSKSYTMDLSRSFMTFNVFQKQFSNTVPGYDYLEIKDNSFINSEDSKPYCVHGTPAGVNTDTSQAYTQSNNRNGYYSPCYLNPVTNVANGSIFFAEFPRLIFYIPSEILNSEDLYSPVRVNYYNEEFMELFNEKTLFSSVDYSKSFIKIGDTEKYFLSDLTTINSGMSYKKEEDNYQIYPLYSSKGTSGNPGLNLCLSGPSLGISPLAAVTYTGKPYESRTLKIIRGNSDLVRDAIIVPNITSSKQEKVRTYFQMIENQNFKKNKEEFLFLEPEKSITLLADYEVFKSPYTINGDGTKNFHCFDETGRPLDRGTTFFITPEPPNKLIFNVRCPTKDADYEILGGTSPYCGKKGITSFEGSLLENCTQRRNINNINFIDDKNSCIVSKDTKNYNTLNNQFMNGFQLKDIVHGKDFQKEIDDEILVPSSFFTKLYKEGKVYQGGEEFFIEKVSNSYYISTVNGNKNFVSNLQSWKKIYTYENNITSQPGQKFFSVYMNNTEPNKINKGLGKHGDTFKDLTLIKSYDLCMDFSTTGNGLMTQNYLNQGVQSYSGNQLKPLFLFPDDGGGQSNTQNYNQEQQEASYLGVLQNSLFRKEYLNDTGTSNPDWSNIKLESLGGTSPKISQRNPITCTFRISTTDEDNELSETKFKFVSRFYDSDLSIPWKMDVEAADYFNPDLTYFNSFFYTFLKTTNEQNQYGFYGQNSTNLVKVPELADLFYSGDLKNYNSNTYPVSGDYSIELEDNILFLPTNYTNDKEEFDQVNFPNNYPTLIIRKVIDVSIPHEEYKDVSFEELKDYQYISTNLGENSKFEFFNLGKRNSENNLITRNFSIKDVGIFSKGVSFFQNHNQSGIGVSYATGYQMEKNYIEFEFEIDSIDQGTMSTLYSKLMESNFDERNPNKGMGEREIQLLIEPPTYLTPALTARYIKNNVTIPSQLLTSNGITASLSNTEQQGSFNMKVAAQSTEIRNYQGKIYINEFRENSDFFTPQIDRTFDIGDQFDYYASSQTLDSVYQGNKKFEKVLDLVVEDVDVTIPTSDGYFATYDYKCSEVGVSTNSDPFKTDTLVPDVDDFKGWKGFYLYKQVSNGTSWHYQLPYTIYDGTSIRQRTTFQGVSTDLSLKFKGVYQEPSYVGITKDNTFLDYYKFSNNLLTSKYLQGPKYGSDTFAQFSYTTLKNLKNAPLENVSRLEQAVTSLIFATTYSGDAIRSGLLDTMVLTSTNVKDESSGQKYQIGVDVIGKPYGSEYFISTPLSTGSAVTMVNYQRFGKIKNFTLNKVDVTSGLLTSNKGFQIKISPYDTNSYLFGSVKSPIKNAPIEHYTIQKKYDQNDIINFKTKNKNYIRNNSLLSLPYLKNPDPNNVNIPFAVKNNNSWIYPMFLGPGTKSDRLETTIGSSTYYYYEGSSYVQKGQNNLTNYMSSTFTSEERIGQLSLFEPVPRSMYPGDNFSIYDENSFYGEGDIVVIKIRDTNILFVSNIDKNIGNNPEESEFWDLIGPDNALSSPAENYFYPNLASTQNYTNYIEDIKNLNNQNLPALIQTYEMKGKNSKEFCPINCTYYSSSENYEKTFLETDFFNPIRYLFESPIILKENETNNVISLGNSPVSYFANFNITFLQNGGEASEYLGQYMYFLDLKGQEKKYGKSGCSGNLFITKAPPSVPEDTNIDKFTFANSLIFNFIPCDLESQDFIKYGVSSSLNSGMSILVQSMPDYISSDTKNVFPPHGVSCNVMISCDNGTCFRSVYGHFEHNYIVTDADVGTPLHFSDSEKTFRININRKSIIFNQGISGAGCCYGDVWYSSSEGASINYSSGFIIPDENGEVNDHSFIYLNRNFKTIGGVSTVENRDISGFEKSKGDQKINTYEIVPESSDYVSKIYQNTDGGTCIFIQTYKGKLLQQNQSIFRTDTDIENADFLYLPSYDITQNIKVKAHAQFGNKFIGDVVYNIDKENGVNNLNNKLLSPLVFKQNKNQLLLDRSSQQSYNLFSGQSSVGVVNFGEVLLINFKNSSFSIRPNYYSKPITNKDNDFLFNPETSLDLSLPLSCNNTRSTDTFVSKKLENMIGLSIGIDFSEFLDYNTKYLAGNKVPGRTNVQIQLREIRENQTNFYIEDNNKCSVYFEPEPGLEINSEIASTLNAEYQPTSGYYSNYSGTQQGPRIFGNFLRSETKLNLTSKDTVTLGCNQLYLIDQTSATNEEPIVFSNNEFGKDGSFSETNIVMGLPGNQELLINYFLNDEKVTYDQYLLEFEPKKIKDRIIEIVYRVNFDVNDLSGAEIYFGTPSGGSEAGGKMTFIYH